MGSLTLEAFNVMNCMGCRSYVWTVSCKFLTDKEHREIKRPYSLWLQSDLDTTEEPDWSMKKISACERNIPRDWEEEDEEVLLMKMREHSGHRSVSHTKSQSQYGRVYKYNKTPSGFREVQPPWQRPIFAFLQQLEFSSKKCAECIPYVFFYLATKYKASWSNVEWEIRSGRKVHQ